MNCSHTCTVISTPRYFHSQYIVAMIHESRCTLGVDGMLSLLPHICFQMISEFELWFRPKHSSPKNGRNDRLIDHRRFASSEVIYFPIGWTVRSCSTAELARQKAANPPQASLFGAPTMIAPVQRRGLFAINALERWQEGSVHTSLFWGMLDTDVGWWNMVKHPGWAS